MEKEVKELEATVKSQKEQLTRYETRLKGEWELDCEIFRETSVTKSCLLLSLSGFYEGSKFLWSILG